MSMTTGHIDPRYGEAATAPPWADIERLLTNAQLYWIITVRADGRPHAVPLVGVWHDGAFAFCTGSDEQKQRNLDANPLLAVTTGSTGVAGWNRVRTSSSRARRCGWLTPMPCRRWRTPGSPSTATTGSSR